MVGVGRRATGGAQSDRWPTIEVGGTASRSKQSLAAFGGQGSIYRNFFDASLTFRYELDLWGRLRQTRSAALADAQAAVEIAVDTLDDPSTLVAQVVIPDFHDEMLANLEAATEFGARISGRG